jgi:hypothetical protein
MALTRVSGNLISSGTVTGTQLAASLTTSGPVTVGGLLTAPTATSNSITSNNITVSNITVSNTGTFLGSVVEKANIVSTSGITSSTIIAPNQGGVVYFTANSVANATINFTGLSSVGVGNIASYVVIVTNNTANPKYISTIQVDGVNQSTSNTFWAGGAPTTGTANTDIYSFNVIKMSATPTYNIFAQVSNFRP